MAKRKSKKKVVRRRKRKAAVDKLLTSVSRKYMDQNYNSMVDSLLPEFKRPYPEHPMCRCMKITVGKGGVQRGDAVTYMGKPVGVALDDGTADGKVSVAIGAAGTFKLPAGQYEFTGCGGGGGGSSVTDDKYRPAYYGGEADPYEPFKVIRAWGLNFFLGNALKYIKRAGKKDGNTAIDDLKKARTYLDSEIRELEGK